MPDSADIGINPHGLGCELEPNERRARAIRPVGSRCGLNATEAAFTGILVRSS